MLNQSNQNLILETIETITNWGLEDEHLSWAIQSHAELLAGVVPDTSETDYDFH